MRITDMVAAGSVILFAQGGDITAWFTAEKFAMGLCIYMVMRMEKTMGELRDAILGKVSKRKGDR